jgi:hypothetical protein
MSTATAVTSHILLAHKGGEPPMTLHVGMVGNDGIVLAGDTLTFDYPRSESNETRQGLTTWMSQTESKIRISGNGKIAVSCAGNMREARPLADHIIAELTPEYWELPEARICEIARSFAASCTRWRDTQFLILLSEPMSLYLLDCVPNEITNELLTPQCRMVPWYAFDGDTLNASIFWAIRYCRPLPPQMRTVQRLKRLAAQIIADAGTINSGGIGGLEMVYCDGSGIHKMTNGENAELLKEAQERSNQVQELILGGWGT